MNDVVKNLVLWIVIAVVLLSVFHSFGDRTSSAENLIYSDFLTQVKSGQVRQVTIEGQNITGNLISGEQFSTYSPGDDGLVGDLLNNNVEIKNPSMAITPKLLIVRGPILNNSGIIISFLRFNENH